MAVDPTYGVNPHQSVEGMVKEYEKKVGQADKDSAACNPVPKSEMDVDREGERLVAKGRLDPETGQEIPLTPKARKLTQWVPSQRFMDNFDLIKWGC
jgi:hypothetical protein